MRDSRASVSLVLPVGCLLAALGSIALAVAGCGSSTNGAVPDGGGGTGGAAGGASGTDGGEAGPTSSCQAAGGAGGGVLAATLDGTPVTFTDVNSYYEGAGDNAGNPLLRITVTGKVSDPVCRNITVRITYYFDTPSSTPSCADTAQILEIEYVSDAGYFRTSNVPESCSGTFAVPPSGYGPLMGTFTATLLQPGPMTQRPVSIALTAGMIDLTVPFR